MYVSPLDATGEVNDPMTKLAAWQDLEEPYLASLPIPVGQMPPHRMGVHLIGQSEANYQFIAQLNPAAVKIVDPDPTVVRRVLATTGPHCIVVLRNHPLSEEKSQMTASPFDTGVRHANYWIAELTTGRFKEFNGNQRIAVVGINEPGVHNLGEELNVMIYTRAFLERLTQVSIRGLALNLSVGWPREVAGTIQWNSFAPLEKAILDNNGFLCVHEYWYPNPQTNWGSYSNRISRCPFSVPIIIGENAYTRQLVNASQPWGWQGNLTAETYADQLWYYNDSVDVNVYATMAFTTGYASQEWASKDTGPAHANILAKKRNYTKWPAVWPVKKTTTPPAPEPADPKLIILPKFTGLVTGFYGSLYFSTATQKHYAHEGVDLSKAVGQPIVMPANGIVAWVGTTSENSPYGLYVRTYHKQLGVCFFFAHCSETLVKQNDVVKQGTLIARSGNTGNSTGPHEHVEVRYMAKDQMVYRNEVSSHAMARVDLFGFMAGWIAAGNTIKEA